MFKGGGAQTIVVPPLHKSTLSFRLLLNKNIPYINRSLLRTERGMETFLTKNAKNGTEQNDHSSTQNETERDGTEQEQND